MSVLMCEESYAGSVPLVLELQRWANQRGQKPVGHNTSVYLLAAPEYKGSMFVFGRILMASNNQMGRPGIGSGLRLPETDEALLVPAELVAVTVQV